MRITTKELNRDMLNVINKRYSDLADIQMQLSTGKRLMRPSDDPVDVANDLLLKTRQKELQQYKSNIEDSISFMSITETAMSSTNTLMQRIRELALEAASDTQSADERRYINAEVEQLTRQLVGLINTQYKGDYIFNGQQTKLAPLTIGTSSSQSVDDYTAHRMAYFNATGAVAGDTFQIFDGSTDNAVTNILPGTFELSVAGTTYLENTDFTVDYEAGTITLLNTPALPLLAVDVTPGTPAYDINGVRLSFDSLERSRDIFGQIVSNRGIIERDIENGVSMQINVGMDEMITDPSSGNTLIGSVVRLGQALVQDDQSTISQAIDELDIVFSTILSAQSKNGARMNRLETTLERNENQYTQVTSLQSELEDAEMAETASKFMLTQNVYTAALQSMAKIIQPSLVNFL